MAEDFAISPQLLGQVGQSQGSPPAPPLPTSGEGNEKHIYDYTVCVDYNDECVDQHEQKAKLCVAGFFEPEDEVVENCPYEPFKERPEDVAVIGKPKFRLSKKSFAISPRSDAMLWKSGRYGCFVFLDTQDGEVAVWDVMHSEYRHFGSAKDCFTHLKRRFEEIELFPTHDGRVFTLQEDRHRGLKYVIRSFGWPSTDEDGKEWKREECLKEVERTIYDY